MALTIPVPDLRTLERAERARRALRDMHEPTLDERRAMSEQARRDLPQTVRDLDFAARLDYRAHLSTIPQDVLTDASWGYVGGMSPQALVDAESHLACYAPGLVSVLTTQKRPSRPSTPFAVTAQAQAIHAIVGTIPLDPAARRLSRLRMHVGVAARQHCVTQPHGVECLMVTLTYRGTNADWQPNHIRAFMDHVRKWYGRRDLKCRYVWVAELQKRGVIHYHVALWVPKGTRLPKPDECGWWPHGMTRIEVAKAAIPYLLKYLSKDTSKTFGKFPHGARIYGVGGLDHAMRRARRWLSLPAFVQGNSSIDDQWTRAVGGGWTAPTGEHYASEFECVKVGGVRCARRVLTHPRAIDASGPFSWIRRSDGPSFTTSTAVH